jgi:hypothetical protein
LFFWPNSIPFDLSHQIESNDTKNQSIQINELQILIFEYYLSQDGYSDALAVYRDSVNNNE